MRWGMYLRECCGSRGCGQVCPLFHSTFKRHPTDVTLLSQHCLLTQPATSGQPGTAMWLTVWPAGVFGGFGEAADDDAFDARFHKVASRSWCCS